MKIYMKVSNVNVLGPGNRYGLWLQGCNKHCRGCIAPNSWDMHNGIEYSVDYLANEILSENVEGITISGGEPFLQSKELCELLLKLKKEKDIGIIVYTGFSINELKKSTDFYILKILKFIDVLIDGEYIEELDDDRAFRGSSNQRIIHLSDRYVNYFKNANICRENEFLINGDEFMIFGIPNKNSKILKNKFEGE